MVTAGSAGICGVVVLLAMAALVVGPDMSALEVPIGPMGTVMPFGLDALAASFLLLLFLVMPCADTAPLPLAAMAVTVLAGNGFALAVGLLLLGGIASLRPAAFPVVCSPCPLSANSGHSVIHLITSLGIARPSIRQQDGQGCIPQDVLGCSAEYPLSQSTLRVGALD